MAMFGGKAASVSAAPETPGSWVTRGLAKGYGMFGLSPQEAWRRAQQLSTALQAVTPLGVADVAWQDTQNLLAGRKRDPLAMGAMFLGVKAKGADLATLRKAAQMRKAGAPREDIWRDTGWFKGVDGKWRFEVDDSGAEITDQVFNDIKQVGKYHGPFDAALSHPRMWEQMPSAAKMRVTMAASERPKGHIESAYIPGQPVSKTAFVSGPGTGSQRSVALHELQHFAQDANGFAIGGSPELFSLRAQPEVVNDALVLRSMADQADGTMAAALERFRLNMGREPHGNATSYAMAYDKSRLQDAVNPMGAYRRLAGEVEARNTQLRRNMSAEQRRAAPPWETQDVADADQIVRRR